MVDEPAEPLDVEQFARDNVREWSAACQALLDFQRRVILSDQPTPEQREAHRTALKWMLRFGRAIYSTAADPEYPDKTIASEIYGRLLQLEHSWRMTQEQMPDAEAEALIKEHFPDEG